MGRNAATKSQEKNTTNLKRHSKAFHNEIEVSQDINVTLLSILKEFMPTHEAVVNVSHFNASFRRQPLELKTTETTCVTSVCVYLFVREC